MRVLTGASRGGSQIPKSPWEPDRRWIQPCWVHNKFIRYLLNPYQGPIRNDESGLSTKSSPWKLDSEDPVQEHFLGAPSVRECPTMNQTPQSQLKNSLCRFARLINHVEFIRKQSYLPSTRSWAVFFTHSMSAEYCHQFLVVCFYTECSTSNLTPKNWSSSIIYLFSATS